MTDNFFGTLISGLFNWKVPATTSTPPHFTTSTQTVNLNTNNPAHMESTVENTTEDTVENTMPETTVISQGNLYLDFDRNADDSTDRYGRTYPGLHTQLQQLRKKYGNALFPSMQTGDDILDYFRDIFFPHQRTQQFFISNLTLGKTPKSVNLLIRPAIILPSQDMEPPAGLMFALKVNYRIEMFDKRTQSDKINLTPILSVSEIVEMPNCEQREFEKELTVTVFSVGPNQFWNNNIISPNFVDSLLPISQKTTDHLNDWFAYLTFWERYTQSQLDGLRFVKAEVVNGTYRFLVVAESQQEFQKHSRILRNDDVNVFPLSRSTDAWTFKLNEEDRIYGKELGDYEKPDNKRTEKITLSKEVQKSIPWNTPYCVYVSFKLNEDSQNNYEKQLAKAETKEDIDKIESDMLQRIPQDGFLAPSGVGDFALINRLRQQLTTLQKQSGYAPFLSSYLFDIKNARQPKTLTEITDWMNPNMNEDQKAAVQKMLSVPDIGLLQGPPGTGKTTVIAELIYQFVKQGKSVLVASQANLAVDNALERLTNNPLIRAVRLGKKAEEDCPYSEGNTLTTYYKAVAENCKKNTLDNWKEWETQVRTLTNWFNRSEILYVDVLRLKEQYDKTENDYDRNELAAEFKDKREQLRKLILQMDANGKVSEYPQLRTAVEKRLQNAKEQYEKIRPFQESLSDILQDWITDLQNEKTLEHDKNSYLKKEFLVSCNVAGVSCTENSRTLSDAGLAKFDVVIVDEVSKATPPELIMPMLLAKTAILVGDHRQLPPVFKQKGANFEEQSFEEIVADQDENGTKDNYFNEESLKRFEKMVSASWFKQQFEDAPDSLKATLWTQYRMHREIMQCVNPFYEGRLICGINKSVRHHGLTLTGERSVTILTPERHVVWLDSSTKPSGIPNVEENIGTGKTNKLEAEMIAKMLVLLELEYRKQELNKRKQVAVITFYGKQLREIRNTIQAAQKQHNIDNWKAIQISVNTVDKFQGQEREIVFVSMVRCPQHRLSRLANTASFERINVAFSRAQELLVIVGSARTFREYPVVLSNLANTGKREVNVYGNLIGEIHRNGCFHAAKDILPNSRKSSVSFSVNRANEHVEQHVDAPTFNVNPYRR